MTILLLTTDVKILAKSTNAMWDILLATEEEAKPLPGNVLIAKARQLHTEYMGMRRTRITIHGVPLGISEDHWELYLPYTGRLGMSLLSR